jgi:hypothetical protein
MKRTVITVASILSLVSIIPAFADEMSGQSPQDQQTNFEAMKSDYLAKIDERMNSLERQKECVQNALKEEDLRSCLRQHRDEMNANRKNMRKKGRPIGLGEQVTPQAE